MNFSHIIDVERLGKSYGSLRVLSDVTVKVAPGEIVMLVGPSGAGKSTFLRCINHIETWSEGSVHVCGVDMGGSTIAGRYVLDADRATAQKRRSIGMVFQRFNLFPHLSALDNVAIGPHRVLGVPLSTARAEAAELLHRVKLGDHQAKSPPQLSGGQQQRVGIARALAMKPQLLLLDEPTSALDPELVGEVLDVIAALAKQGMTMMIVTHELAFAREVGSRVLFMEAGRVHLDSSPAEFFNTEDTRVRSFLKRVHSN
jgi:polar amino acid transport system ATP-binding protein